jgi:Fic family protein
MPNDEEIRQNLFDVKNAITHDILALIAKTDEFKGAWVLFFLRSLDSQITRLKTKVEREKLILAALPELSLKLVELAKERGRITVQDAVILTGASRNTIKLHLQKLVSAGHLARHGAGRGVWYSLV